MPRLLLLAGIATALTLNSSLADEAKGKAVPHEVYPDYFEKNTAPKNKDEKSTYLVFAKNGKNKFGDWFSLRPPLMNGPKPIPVPEKALEKNIVVALVKRGNAVTKYKIEQVTVDGDTLDVQYTATPEKASTATFASPLIISTERGTLKKVNFIENGKTVSTIEIK